MDKYLNKKWNTEEVYIYDQGKETGEVRNSHEEDKLHPIASKKDTIKNF